MILFWAHIHYKTYIANEKEKDDIEISSCTKITCKNKNKHRNSALWFSDPLNNCQLLK